MLERDPGNLQAHLISAWSRDSLGDYAGSVAYYQKSLAIADPEGLAGLVSEIRLAIADLHRRNGHLDEALFWCTAFEKLHGRSSRCSLVRALTLQELGRGREAIELFREAVSQGPDDITTQYYLGVACKQAGLLAEAQQAFLDLAECDSGAHAVWFLLASVRAELGDRAGMFEALHKAAEHSLGFTRLNVLDENAFADYLAEEPFQAFLVQLYGGEAVSL